MGLLDSLLQEIHRGGAMSILSYNGGAVVAMTGDECVAVCSDLRYGRELQTIATDFPKVFEMNPYLWVGLPGLATDIQTVKQKIEFRMNMYELKESRQMKPKTFANMVSNMLYESRFGPFLVEPIVAGLDPVTFKPYICNMDLIGCITEPVDFVAGGTCEEQLMGMCETLWEPKMKPDQLFECISQVEWSSLIISF